MIELLFDLPVSVVQTVLSEWVQLTDLTHLDTAFCSHARREDLLRLLGSDGLSSNDDYHLQYNTAVDMWEWVLKRNIKMTLVTSDCVRLQEEDALQYVKSTAAHILRLEINLDSDIFARHCTKLAYLSCTASFDDQLSAVLRGNPNLEKLKLTTSSTKKTADIYKTIKLPRLTQLSIACGDEACLVAALNMATRLLKLELMGVTKSFPTLGQHCPHIRSLHVSGWQEVRGLDIASFTSFCPLIVNLELSMCNTLTDADLLGIVQNLPGLRSIRLHAFKFILTDDGIGHITKYCANTLEVFQIKFCTANALLTQTSLDALRQRCTKLHTFHCIGSIDITPDLQCFTVLEIHSENLTNPVLKTIADNCPELQVMDFWFGVKYKRCTEKGFAVLLAKCLKLRTIVANDEDAPALRKLVSAFPQVKVVKFDRSYRYDIMDMPI